MSHGKHLFTIIERKKNNGNMNKNMAAGTAPPASKAALLRSRKAEVREIMGEVAELRTDCDAKWTELMEKERVMRKDTRHYKVSAEAAGFAAFKVTEEIVGCVEWIRDALRERDGRARSIATWCTVGGRHVELCGIHNVVP